MEVVVILPAFQPSSALPALVRAFHEALAAPVVVVDDGSDATCRALFDAAAAAPAISTATRPEPGNTYGKRAS